MMTRNIRRWQVVALLAGAALRVLFLTHHPRFGGDTLVYGDLATNLLHHHILGLTEEVIRPTLIRLPGYPLFLAACFTVFGTANYLAVVWLQAGLDLLTCVLLAEVARRVFGPRAGLGTLWLAALCPFTANYCAVPLAETVSFLAVALALWTLARWRERWSAGHAGWAWLIGLGASLALAVLVRPEQGLLAAALVPAVAWIGWRDQPAAAAPRRSAWARCAPTLAVLALVAAPLALWGLRNWRVFHIVQPLAPRYANDPGESVPLGFQRWYRTWAVDFKSTVDIYWVYDGSPLEIHNLPARAFDSAAQRQQTAQIFQLYNQNQASTQPIDDAFASLAAQRIQAHPLRYYVEMPVLRELDMWFRPRTELMRLPIDWWQVREHPAASAFEIAYGLLDAAYVLLGLAGIVLWLRQRNRPWPALLLPALAFVLLRCALLLTLDNSEPRYTLECFPVLMIFAAYALTRSTNSAPTTSRVR